MVTEPAPGPAPDPAPKVEGRTLFDVIQAVANLAVALTLIVTVALFWLQQRDSDHKRQIETAVQFIMLGHEDLYIQSKEAISEAYQNDPRTELVGGNQISNEVALKEEIALKAGLRNIERLADLHRAVIGCVESDMCDSKTIENSYRTQVWSLYCLVPTAARDRMATRLNAPDYWWPLERYIAGGAHWRQPNPDERSALRSRAAAEQSCVVARLPQLAS